MRPRSLRARLTLVFCLVGGIVLGIAALGAEALVERAIWASVDASLLEEAETLATIDDPRTLADATRQIGLEHDPGPDKFVRLVGADRQVLASFGQAPDWLDLGRGTRIEMRTVRGRTVRVARHGGPGDRVCVIGVRVDRQIRHRLGSRIALGTMLVLVVVALGMLAYAITRQATRQIDRLAAELETIEASSLDRRLSATSFAEIDRLASVLNRLLARLDGAMGALRRFTADAAHELRTPIAALRTHLELADASDPAEREARLADAGRQAERLQRLAEDLLTLSALEGAAPGRAAVAIDAVAREVCEFFEPIAQEQGRTFRSSLESASVAGDAKLLKRLLLNLIGNAFRHTPPSSGVAVSVAASDHEARLEIRDRGPGLDPDDAARAFERFRRGAHAGDDGAGLGLAICREIVERHRGTIVLESTRESGTCVRVSLPLA